MEEAGRGGLGASAGNPDGRTGRCRRGLAGVRVLTDSRRLAGENWQPASRAALDGRTLGGLRGYCLHGSFREKRRRSHGPGRVCAVVGKEVYKPWSRCLQHFIEMEKYEMIDPI